MDATLPEISSVSWSSFMTGVNPAKHGIYGFMDLKPGTYQMIFPSYPHLKTETIWDTLGKRGKRSVVINLPGTYPARPHEGVLISGFVAIDLKKAVHPASILPALEATGYRIDVDTSKGADADFLYKDLDRDPDGERKGLRPLLEGGELGSLRGRYHRYGPAPALPVARGGGRKRPEPRQGHGLLRAGRRGRRPHARTLTDQDLCLLMSDHGFCGIQSEVYVNRYLANAGFLKWEKDPPDSFEDISADSRAFALDPSRIYVHRKGRYPKGSVEEGDVPAVREELKALFLSMEKDGRARHQGGLLPRSRSTTGPSSTRRRTLSCSPTTATTSRATSRRPRSSGARTSRACTTATTLSSSPTGPCPTSGPTSRMCRGC